MDKGGVYGAWSGYGHGRGGKRGNGYRGGGRTADASRGVGGGSLPPLLCNVAAGVPPFLLPPGRPASVLRQSIGRRAGRSGSVAGPAFLTVATQRHWRRVAAWVAPATVAMVTSRRFDTATLNGLLMQRRWFPLQPPDAAPIAAVLIIRRM